MILCSQSEGSGVEAFASRALDASLNWKVTILYKKSFYESVSGFYIMFCTAKMIRTSSG